MAGITGKLSVDMSDAIRGVKQFNQELYRPIGIVEQLEINIQDLGIAIRNATDPTQLKKLTAELQTNETVLARYTGRGLKQFTEGQRGMQMAMNRSVQALMGLTFILSSFDTGNATDETSKLRQSLLQGAQSAVGYTFALQALGGTIGRIAMPVGIAMGLLNTLMSIIKNSGEEAKKAAEEGLDKYIKSLDEISKRQAVIAEQSREEQIKYKEALQAELDRLEARKKRLEEVLAYGYRPTTKSINETMALLKEVEEKIRLIMAEMAGITITTKPVLSLDEQNKLADAKRKRNEEDEKKLADAHRIWLETMAQEEEDFDKWMADYDWDLYVSTKQKKAQAEKEAEESKLKALRNEYEMSLQLNDSAMNLADTLSSAFERAGDTGAAAFMRILSLALQIARTVSMTNFGEVGGTAGTLDILSSLFGLGFARGGYTGNLPRSRVAGVVHGGEVVFEKPIVDVYRNELLALRSSLQGGSRVAGYAGGGFVGQQGGINYMVGKIDIDNGKIWLRRTMPGYEDWRRMKGR